MSVPETVDDSLVQIGMPVGRRFALLLLALSCATVSGDLTDRLTEHLNGVEDSLGENPT
jgi:hypothetical protein